MRLRFVITAALMLSCAQASAQRDEPWAEQERASEADDAIGPVSVHAAGILVLPVDETNQRFAPGGGFAVGLTLSADTAVSLRLEYMYSRYDLHDDALDLLALDGNHTMQAGSLGLMIRPTLGLPFGFYFVGGGGLYHRRAEVARIEGSAERAFCDPLLFFCFPNEVPASHVLGSESSTDYGLNAGIGFYLMLAPPLRAYLEARYHYVWGPEFQDFTGRKVDSDAGYLPVVLGLAF